jgi:transmembrane sensor
MEQTNQNIIPWELIGQSLVNELSGEEEKALQQWLNSNAEHEKIFADLKVTWEKNIGEYELYQTADVSNAWNDLNLHQTHQNGLKEKSKLIKGQFRSLNKVRIWTSVAAIFLIGVLTFIFLRPETYFLYQTASNETRNIILPDGSKVTLNPLTELRVSRGFNKQDRTVILNSGKAVFVVQHLPLPFVVNMEKSIVKDIGTSFIIDKKQDSIKVEVITGKVEFTKLKDNETKELTAGMSITLDVEKNDFSLVKIDTANFEAPDTSLDFKNTPLSDVISKLEKVYNKKIILKSVQLGEKRLTAKLTGVSFDNVMQIVAGSLDLSVDQQNGVYEFKEKTR